MTDQESEVQRRGGEIFDSALELTMKTRRSVTPEKLLQIFRRHLQAGVEGSGKIFTEQAWQEFLKPPVNVRLMLWNEWWSRHAKGAERLRRLYFNRSLRWMPSYDFPAEVIGRANEEVWPAFVIEMGTRNLWPAYRSIRFYEMVHDRCDAIMQESEPLKRE